MVKVKPHNYTQEQIDFIKANAEGRRRCDLLELFNQKFNTNLHLGQLDHFKRKYGVEGIFSYADRVKAGCYKTGKDHYRHKPIGSERVDVRERVYVKTKEHQRHNRLKQVLVWEAANGPVPKGYSIIFGDGDKRNFSLDNLLLVTIRQAGTLYARNLICSDIEMTKIAITIADIYIKLADIKRKGKKLTLKK